MKPPQLHPALRISLIYALFAGAWIILSDMAASMFAAFSPDVLQSYKGLFFVALTTLLLFLLLRREWNARALIEADLRHLNTELEQRVNHRTAELDAANEQLKEIDELKSKFIADVTHELRNPITSLGIRAHMVKQRLPEQYRDSLFELEMQVNQVLGLVESILVLSRVERQKAD